MDGRKAITTYARTFVGSHYLWGSAGAFPGVLNGARYRPGSVPWNEPSLELANLSLCAAKCDVAGHYVCAGRFEKVAGGQTVSETDISLNDSLTRLKSQYGRALHAQWESTRVRLTPRVVRGANVASAGKIAMAENCYGVRHFDCISFVNFVLTGSIKVMDAKTGWWGGIETYAKNWCTDIALDEPAVAGDILIRYSEDDQSVRHYHHIGFLDDNNYVVQAEMASAGVHADEKYSPSRWQMRRRLDSQYIL